MQSLSPRKMYHQSIPKCNSAATTQRALLLSQSRMNEVSSSYCGLNKRSIAKRISMLSSRRREVEPRLSSTVIENSVRETSLERIVNNATPTKPQMSNKGTHQGNLGMKSCKQLLLNRSTGPTSNSSKLIEICGQNDSSISRRVLPNSVVPLTLRSLSVDRANQPSAKSTSRSSNVLNFKRERSRSLIQCQGDTDEAAKFKSLRRDKLLDSPTITFSLVKSKARDMSKLKSTQGGIADNPLVQGLANKPSFTNKHWSSTLQSQIYSESDHSCALRVHPSRDMMNLRRALLKVTQFGPEPHKPQVPNVPAGIKCSVTTSEYCFGDHQSVASTERDIQKVLGRVPSFAITRPLDAMLQMKSIQVPARCDTIGKSLASTSNAPRRNSELVLDSNLDYERILFEQKSLEKFSKYYCEFANREAKPT